MTSSSLEAPSQHSNFPSLPFEYRYEQPDQIEPAEIAKLMRSAGWRVKRGEIEESDSGWQNHGINTLHTGVRDTTGNLAGYGCILYSGDCGDLFSMVVSKRHRHLGIGKAIIGARLTMAREVGITSLVVPSIERTNTLVSYYLENGFTQNQDGQLLFGPNPVSVTQMVLNNFVKQ